MHFSIFNPNTSPSAHRRHSNQRGDECQSQRRRLRHGFGAEGARRRRTVWDSVDQIVESYRSKPTFERWRPDILRLYAEHGAFQRDLLLPSEVNAEAAKAVYKDGILEITLPVTRPHSGRHLTIVVR